MPAYTQSTQPQPTPSRSLQLPSLGDGGDMTSSAERRLGDRIAREIYKDPDYLDDPLLGEYVQGIWQPLMAAARQRGELNAEIDERFAWEIFLARDRSVNAFALPGGYFGLHLGLIGLVTSRDELASVMGHELSHVTQRHIARLIAQQSRQAPWLIGALILGALAASKSPDAANALILGGQGVAIQNQLNFSRDMEREADRVGYGVATNAGFEAQGFVTMFAKLQQANRINDNGSFPYLRSHPLTSERIADMQARQQLQPATARRQAQDLVHPMMAARARVLASPGVDVLRQWVKEAEGMPTPAASAVSAPTLPAASASAALTVGAASAQQRRIGVLYAGALASARLRDYGPARGFASRLAGAVTGDAAAARIASLLQAEIALLERNGPLALQAVGSGFAGPVLQRNAGASGGGSNAGANEGPGGSASATSTATRGRAELMLWSQAQLVVNANAGLADAAQRLQTWTSVYPRDAMAWQQLSNVQAALGQTAQSARASSESRAALLDYPAALDRMKAAQLALRQGPARGGNDHIDASIIDLRVRQLQAQVTELAREKALER